MSYAHLFSVGVLLEPLAPPGRQSGHLGLRAPRVDALQCSRSVTTTPSWSTHSGSFLCGVLSRSINLALAPSKRTSRSDRTPFGCVSWLRVAVSRRSSPRAGYEPVHECPARARRPGERRSVRPVPDPEFVRLTLAEDSPADVDRHGVSSRGDPRFEGEVSSTRRVTVRYQSKCGPTRRQCA